MNALQMNVYITINPINPTAIIKAGKGAKDNDIIRAHYSFADADDLQGLNGLIRKLSITAKPDITVITGTTPHERMHTYWQLMQPCIDMQLWGSKQEQSCKSNAKPILALRNSSRIMRLPGTVSFPSTSQTKKGLRPRIGYYAVRREMMSLDSIEDWGKILKPLKLVANKRSQSQHKN